MRFSTKYNLLAAVILIAAATCSISLAQRGSRGNRGGERTVGRSNSSRASNFRSGGGSVRYSNVGQSSRSKFSSGGSSSYTRGRSTVSSDRPSFPSERSRVSSDRPAVGTGRSKYTSNRGTVDITPPKTPKTSPRRSTDKVTRSSRGTMDIAPTKTVKTSPRRSTDSVTRYTTDRNIRYTRPTKKVDRTSTSRTINRKTDRTDRSTYDRKPSRFDRTPSNYGSVRHSTYYRRKSSNISFTPTRSKTYRPSNIKTASRRPSYRYSRSVYRSYPRSSWGPGRPGRRYLPRGARPVYYRKHRYYCWNHRYYRPYFYFGSLYYYPVAAPIGIYIDTLPDYYSLVRYGGITYYVINGDYYRSEYRDNRVVYVVVARPGLPDTPTVISDSAYPNPFNVVKSMSSYLGSQRSFTVVVSDTYDDISESGMDIQRSSRRLVYVTRPDRMEVQYEGDGQQLEIVYNGSNISLVNITANTYSVTPMPGTIDEMLDTMSSEYGVTVPISDFLYSDPNQAMMEGVRTGQYVGLSEVDDIQCHHLAFTTDDVDWELWVETGDKPLPRKLVITYKNVEGQPRYIMTPHTWDIGYVPTNAYELAIPADAVETKMQPVKLVEAQDAAL